MTDHKTDHKYDPLFEPLRIGNLRLKNRITAAHRLPDRAEPHCPVRHGRDRAGGKREV